MVEASILESLQKYFEIFFLIMIDVAIRFWVTLAHF